MKRRRVCQDEGEEVLKWLLKVERPMDRNELKKSLLNIVKFDFMAGNTARLCNTAFPKEIAHTIVHLCSQWSQDTRIALLLLKFLRNVSKSLCWGEAVAAELCQPSNKNLNLTALVELFLNENSSLDLKITTCEIIQVLKKYYRSAESLGYHARTRIRNYLMDLLSNDQNNTKVSELCLSSIYWLLCESSRNEQQKFSTIINIETIVSFCSKHEEVEGTVLKEASKVFSLLIEADRQSPALLTEDVINILLHTVENNEHDLELNESACRAFNNLSEDKNICDMLEESGGTACVTKALRQFPESKKIAVDGINYLGNAVTSPYEEEINSKTDPVASDASLLRDIADTMRTHQDDAGVQESACRAVGRLLENNPAAECKIGEDEGQYSIHNCVVAAMNIHILDSYVFQAACSALHEMATSSSRLQQLLVAKGTYVTIIDHMRAKKDTPDIQEWGYRALRALCFKNVLQEEILVKYQLLTDIKETLHVYCDRAGVLEEALGLLACLATDMEIVRRQFMLELIYERVVEVMEAHENAVPLLKTCFETLAVFAASEEQSMLIGVLDGVEKVMRNFRASSGIQVRGCILIQLLANDDVCDNEITCSNIVNLVCEAISNFPCNEEVQTEGIVTLKVIAETESGLRELINQESYQYMFRIMNSRTLPSDVLEIAAEGLLLLCNDQKSKDQIFQWAVINDKFKEADWLLQHGANVNSDSVERPNLLIAAEMKAPRMVSFLLEHGSSHVQEALKIAKRQRNHKLTGILLTHIGLEKKSGVLAWGNLNIAELKRDYFSPSLVGKQDSNSTIMEEHFWDDHFRNASESRQHRISSSDAMRCTRLDSINSEEDPEENGCVHIRRSRPPSLTGAVLPFISLDPRIEGSINNERFFRLDSPALSNSYPGHPDGCLIPDDACGSLLQSPDRETKFGLSQMFNRSSSATTLNYVSSQGESSDDSPLESSRARKKQASRKNSAGELRLKTSSETKQFIKYADLSCNSLSDINIELVQSKMSIVKSLFNGLVGLDLRCNRLKNLPAEVCAELKQLKQLHLEGNELQEFPYAILRNNAIETLNLKKNKITQFDKSKITCRITLTSLDISDNQLTSFPVWIGDCFPALSNLRLSGNKISKLSAKAVDLSQLKQLDLSHNELESMPGQFLERCVSLRRLDLSHNSLILLPDQSSVTSHRLTHLKLSHNKLAERSPWYVPKFALHLSNLVSLDMSHNKIVEVPSPAMWASRNLQYLNFDHNRIRKLALDGNAVNWTSLSRLSISTNKLERLPPHIGLLTSLNYLDVSHNPIRILPEDLGRLKNLSEFPLDGLSLELHPSIRNGTAREICTFLYSRMKHSVPYLRMKLVVVGREGKGKSSLLRVLQGIKHPQGSVSTVGIEVNSWVLPLPRKHWAKAQSKKASLILSTWDFAGQVDFYSSHQCFLSCRALYLAVYDASQGADDLETLRSWLLNINASAPGASVILVGTNADKVTSENRKEYFEVLQSRIEAFMRSPGFPAFRGSAIVSCIRKNDDIDALRKKILQVVEDQLFKEKGPLEHLVPESYVQLEDVLKEEADRLIDAGEIPIVSRRALLKITQDNDISLEKEELDQAVKFLHEAGVLLRYDDQRLKLEDCYFIHPEWLSQMMAKIVTVREINPFVDEQGILKKADVPFLFRGEKFPEAHIDNYLSILQKFEMMISLGDDRFLIPSKLPEKPRGISKKNELPSDSKSLSRYFKFPYIPVALWSRLISRLMMFQSPIQDESVEKPSTEYWRDGIFVFWSKEKYFEVTLSEAFPNTLEIIVPVSQGGFELLGYLVDHVDTLIEEWYPGLASSDPAEEIFIKRLAPCTHCRSLGRPQCFPLEKCISQSYESDLIFCPSHKGDVSLRDIAPDVLLADVEGKFLIDESELEQKEGEGTPLGGGSFGAVYQTRCKGSNVAVKVFKAGGNIVPHRYLRQEVNILRHIRHPSLVSMYGVCLRPSRSLVMELAHIGSLRKILDNDYHLSRGMQHRIASQICEGLGHLHKHNIVYRDMKPSNILIFSLSMGIFINAKISDYGLSQYVTPSGFSARWGTLAYRAPEVSKDGLLYNKEADIYSLAITLYELVTGGKKPFGDANSQYQMDAATLAKSAIIPIASAGCPQWPDMEDIIARGLHLKPDKRPTAEAISNWLLSADTLCLKQEVGVCKEQTLDCMTILQVADSGLESGLELWVASGSANHSQISWLPLTGKEKRVQGCRGTILKDERILCICSISNNLILAGTQKGHIIVFDSGSHKQVREVVKLPDSVLCLRSYAGQKENLLLAGLANQKLAIFKEAQFKTGDGKPSSIVDLSTSTHPELDCSLSNHLNDDLTWQKHPATCLAIVRRKCLIGCGSSIVVVDLTLGNVDSIMRDCVEEGRTISHIVTDKFIWVASRDSSEVRCLNLFTGYLAGSLCCAAILQERFPHVSVYDCRVVSIYLRSDALWIGCGSGHVIIVEPNLNLKVLAVISRHTSAVRCIVGANGRECGKPVSLVLTGGVGFRERSQPSEQAHKEDCSAGYVLVWDSELPMQYGYLRSVQKTRSEMCRT